MFLVDCPACRLRELRGARSLLGFANTAHGVEWAIACSRCGMVVRSLTGRLCPPAPHRQGRTAA
ncbi:MAG TPA: hypothetical protein VFZ30_04235 [Acidimicrobiales bacterium]